MKTNRIILHIDMNCFFASCEIAQNPDLLDKPVVVARDDPFQRGIILSPNYEARKYGIRTTMIVKEAFNLCKNIVVVEPDMQLYSDYSKKFYQYLLTITNKVEMASIDEAYVDVSDLKVDIPSLASKIQNELLEKYKLPTSIGIAPNKFLAKMASDMKKPLGITILRKRELDKLLWPLPIEDLQGVGKKTAPKLKELGIIKIGDLVNPSFQKILKEKLGTNYANSLINHALGNDEEEVNYFGEGKQSSISSEYTFDRNVYEEDIIKNTLKVIANTISHQLDNQNSRALTIGLKIKYANFRQINRSRGLTLATSEASEIYQIACDILDDNFESGKYDISNQNSEYAIRLIGIFATRLVEVKESVKQITIFDDLSELEKEEEINKILNNLNSKFGKDSIKKGYYSYKKNNK